jgi:uridine kinase
MIIGIGGISNSGKSALAEKIREHYPNKKVKVLCQDNFAMPTPEIPKIRDHTDWEIPSSIDFDRFYNQILFEAKNHDIVIDEGLFVFYEERLNRLYDKMIYLSISEETFLERKRQDHRWGIEPEWYVEHIWHNHHRYFEKIAERKAAFQLSGENPVDYESVFRYLES